MSDQQPRDPWAVPPDPDTAPTQAFPVPEPGTTPTQAFPAPDPAGSPPPGPPGYPPSSPYVTPSPLPADPYATPPAAAYPPPPATGAVPPPYAGAVPPPSYPPGYPGAGYPPGYPAPTQTSQNAVVALVLAIVAWVVCPFIPAVVALFLAASAKREITASGGRISGEGLATAAKVISWLNIGFYLAIGVLVLVLLAVGFFAASTAPTITTFPTATFSLGA